MKEIRFHGRGGQGAVLAAELLVLAAFEDGTYGQAFPAFGGERRGAPVQAFIRLDTRPIRVRYRVTAPDWLMILDPTLLGMVDVLQGLQPDGLVILNSERPPSGLEWTREALVFCVPATRIAVEILGQPIANSAMLGAFAAATGAVSLAAVQKAFLHRFPGELGARNSRAAEAAYEWLRQKGAEPVRVGPSPEMGPSSEMGPSQWMAGAVSSEIGRGSAAPGEPLHFAAVTGPRTSLAYPTGTWRYSRPVFDQERCTGCGLCAMYCPDACIFVENKKYDADDLYCKGCGICACECPASAIRMVAEEA